MSDCRNDCHDSQMAPNSDKCYACLTESIRAEVKIYQTRALAAEALSERDNLDFRKEKARAEKYEAECKRLKAMQNPNSKDGRHIGTACLKHDLTGCGCGTCLAVAQSSLAVAVEALEKMACSCGRCFLGDKFQDCPREKALSTIKEAGK